MTLDVCTAAYIAGIMDGEGCFRIDRFPTKRSPIGFQYRTIAELAMCDRAIVEFVATATGKTFSTKKALTKGGRSVYVLTYRNGIAANFIRAILPFLRGKKDQAKLCLHFEDNVTPGRGRTYRPEDKAICEDIRQKVKDLKRPVALRC